MPRSNTSNVRAAEVAGEYRLREASLDNAARLDQTELKGAYGLVQAQVEVIEKAIGRQYELRAKRQTDLQNAAADYVTAMNRGSLAARINALVNLKRGEATHDANLASNVFTPNTSLLNSYMAPITDYQASSTSWKDDRIAKPAWREFLKNAKSEEEFISLLPEMERRHGKYEEQGFGTNSTEAARYTQLLDAGKIKQAQIAETEAANNGFYTTFDTWAANKGFDLNDPTQRSLAVDRYIAEEKISDEDLPKPSAGFISTINKWAANPEKYAGTWDSDIQANISDLDARLAKVKGEAPTRPDRESPATLNEILGGWLSRPDVRDWAESHGFKLGELVEPDPDTQQLIDQGLYPKELLVNGRIYKSSPDDLAAMRFAYEQMGQDPDKSLEYAKGLAGDPAKRKIVEVTVATGPRPKAVESGKYTDDTGQTYNILKMDDGSFVKLTNEGEASRFLADEDPELLWTTRQEASKKVFDTPIEIEGINEPTETKVIYEMGRIYNKDPMGSVRGIDEDGNEVVIKKEDIVRKEYPDGSRFERTDAQRRKAEEAAKARKQTGFYDAEPIGEKLSRGEKKAAEKAKTELVVPQREPDLAERVTRQRLDRQLEEANRLKALADEARAQGNPQKAARLDARYAEAKAKADRTRSEVDEMVRERRPGIPFVSESGYNEQLQPRGTGQGFQDEFFPEGLGKLRLSDQEKEDAAALAASSKDAEMAAEYAAWREAQRPETPGKFTQTPGSMPGEGVYLPREAARMPTVAPVEPMQPGEAPVEKSKGGASKPGKFSPLVSPDVSGEPPALPATETPQEKAYAIKSGVFSSQDAEAAMAGLNAPLMPLPTTPSQAPTAAPSLRAPVSAPPKAAQAAPVPSPRVPQKRPVGTPPAIGTKPAGQVQLEGFDFGSAPAAPPAKSASVSAGATTSTPITPTASTSPQRKAYGGARKKPTAADIDAFEFSPSAGVESINNRLVDRRTLPSLTAQ